MLELLNQLDGFQPNTQVKVRTGLTVCLRTDSSGSAFPIPRLPCSYWNLCL
jgi:hypothetical protein